MAARRLVVIPAFNEATSLGAVLDRIRAVDPTLDIAVVDDGSSDGTVAVARHAGAHVLRLPFNMGYGAALQTGYKYALRAGYEVVVQLDADGQHEPADIPALLAPVETGAADLAIGSRFIGGQHTYRAPVVRRLGMRLFGLLAFLLTGVRFSDVTSGFQSLNGDLLRFFTTERYPVDYPDADVLIMLDRAGFRITEVPVRMYRSDAGRSMHSGLKPIYYLMKMLLAVSLAPLRKETADRREA